MTGRDPGRSTRRLAARVRWLEDLARISGLVPTADLDTAGAEVADLAEAVRNARDAAEGLLPRQTRESLERVAAAFTAIGRERERAAQEILAISGNLASAGRADPARDHEVARFDEVEARLTAATEAHAREARGAAGARARLRADDQLRMEIEPVLSAGETAVEELAELMHQRLEAEQSRGALFPPWFTEHIGPPCLGAEGVQGWTDTAIAVLIYRLVYEIDDAEHALGPAPASDSPKHQSAYHAVLAAALDSLE